MASLLSQQLSAALGEPSLPEPTQVIDVFCFLGCRPKKPAVSELFSPEALAPWRNAPDCIPHLTTLFSGSAMWISK